MNRQVKPLFRIVNRLRGAFGFAIVLLLIMLVLVFVQSTDLKDSQRYLSENSVPQMIQAQNIQNSVEVINARFRELQSTQDQETLVRQIDDLSQDLVKLRKSIYTLSEFRRSIELTRELGDSVDHAIQDLVLFQQQQTDVFQTIEKIDENSEQILSLAVGSRDLIEKVLLEKVGNNSDFVERMQDESAVIVEQEIGQALSEAFLSALNLAELATNYETIAEQILSITHTDVGDMEDLQSQFEALGFRTRVLVRLVQQLDPSENQVNLARNVLDIRRALDGENGLIENKIHLAKISFQSDVLIDSQFQVFSRVSKKASELAQTSFDEVSAGSNRLALDFERSTGFVFAAGVGSLGLLMLTGFFVVEKQINRRVTALTGSVEAIAGGDLSFPVQQNGRDEVRAISDALQIFRTNAEELDRSNKELEKFAYIAAHDLRSPLVAIRDLAEWTVEDQSNVLSEESTENLALLRTRVERLNNLLSDLLAYSRAGFGSSEYSEFDLAGYLAELQDMLSPEAKFKLEYRGPSAGVYMPQLPLKQILLNLISNAIKHHDKENGFIVVSLKVDENSLYFKVEDDGPGIPVAYHDRVFELFQTLQSRDDVEGSGLGLAIVAKLVKYLRGEISLASNPEIQRGLQVDFTLPAGLGPSSAHPTT